MLRWTFGTPILLLAVWVGVLGATQAAPKAVRLRNEVIITETAGLVPTSGTAEQGKDAIVSGLYLIQFTNRFQPAWQQELRSRRVELLRYVPDDAFVARLDLADLGQLRAMPFVHWVGEYRADHKLHGALQTALRGQNAGGLLAVSILLSPKATAAEEAGARGLLQPLEQESRHRFGGVLRGTISLEGLERLARSPAVLWIEPGSRMKLFDELSSEIVGGQGSPTNHLTFTQEDGFDGRGVRVAVADSGLYTGETNTMHPDLAGRVAALFYYGRLTNAADYHGHGTHVAGIVAGNAATGELDDQMNAYGLGVAPGAAIIVQRVFNGEGVYEAPLSYEVLTRDAVRAGADIASNSWGSDTQGRYDVDAFEFDSLVRDADAETPGDQEYILEFSAGNAGPATQSMASPAVAKNVIATGAAQSDRVTDGKEAMAGFSSRGPCEDGRIKPDVVAPGTWIASLRSPLGDDDNALALISENYLYLEGTSQAGAHVSGAAAVFVQYYRQTYAIGTPSPALVKAALINSGVDMDNSAGTRATPNMDEGWGRVDLTQIILSSRTHEYHDQIHLLTNDQIFERQLIIETTNQPVKLTLVYTDVPGFPAAIPALVNDLDLELIGPDGRVYRGNQFENGESVPDAPSFDRINNVEGIHLAVPLAGEYRVRVIGHSIVQDARADTPAVDQDFALVICAAIPSPETGSVLLDRPAYRAPGRITVTLIDLDLASEPSIPVRVSSETDRAGESLVLLAAGETGVLTGSIATATGPAMSVLQIAHGDWIHVDYYDESEGAWRTAVARADLLAPVITAVTVTNRFGRTVVSWTTDEPANAVVRFGTNTIPNRLATNAALSLSHEVELTDLMVGRTYEFTVESTDTAGNTGLGDDGGVPFRFTSQPAPTVLLVDAYVADPDAASIPLSTYTDPLDQIGVSYDVWDVSTNQMPVLANLQPYQIIIWRINDSYRNYLPTGGTNTIPAAQQSAIQQHLNAGGSFFLASMEILSRLGPGAFRSNALHVHQFIINSSPSPCLTCDKDIGVPGVVGIQNDPITGTLLPTALDYSQYPEIEFGMGQDLGDTFTPATNAVTILLESAHDRPCGLRYPRTGEEGTGRVVFVSFPLDALPAGGPLANSRVGFLRSVIQFLAPGFNGFGTVTFHKSEYRLPDQVVLEVADSDLAGQQTVVVNVSSDSVPETVPVTLRQTTRPGVFQGFITIVSATNLQATGVLRGTNGDRLYAEYFDVSDGLTVHAIASVDSVAPAIFSPTVTPQFDDAIVSWTTSEVTDALVQFGESALLGRTAYTPDFLTNHVLRLTGLIPDHTYFYRVVSRDTAGNTVLDDNGGQLYMFQTRPPLHPPFFDDLEAGRSNWSVFPDEANSAHWTLGSPNNRVETMAHSPENCWGSSLQGESFATVDTFLVSPAIELTGGNVAALRFYHRYDFRKKTTFDTSESGQLLVITNSLTDPVSLATYTNDNSAWEEQVIDLTPYVGQVILLVWRHRLEGFESAARAGWLLDDIEVSITNLPPGTIQVSNNLAQARYRLSGLITRDGQGWNTVITNATPGQYVVTYFPVPYFLTPPPQTNTLVPGGATLFYGLYTFPDTNANRMSDTWEHQFFGTNSARRTCLTDTDGDGYPDCAEFIAGTNPTLTNSHLRLHYPIPQTNGDFLLQWPSVVGRAYQVQGTANDFSNWRPQTGWLQATGGTTSVLLPGPTRGQTNFNYRLEVRP